MAGGFAGAIIGGAAGGLIPGFQGVSGGAFKNAVAEIGYSSLKGAAVGAFSGGLGASFDNRDVGQGIKQGAIGGAIGGGLGAMAKIGLMGTVTPKTTHQIAHERLAETVYGIRKGPYGSVNRTGGMIGWLAKNSRWWGGSVGRNNMVYGGAPVSAGEDIYIEEGIHYVQQCSHKA